MRYSTDVVSWIYLDSYNNKDELMKAIARIPYDGKSTNIAGGILQMRSVQFTAAHGDRPGVPNVAIVVTDGVSIIRPECTIPEAEQAHKQGIAMFSIGVTSKVDSAEVIGISSPPHTPNTYVFFAHDFGNVDNIATTIFNATCNVRPPPGSGVSPTSAPPCEYVNIHYFLAPQQKVSFHAAQYPDCSNKHVCIRPDAISPQTGLHRAFFFAAPFGRWIDPYSSQRD